jgi:hypothetical protein
MSKVHVPKFNEVFMKAIELYKGNFKVLFYVAIVASIIRELLQVMINKMGMNHILALAEKGGIAAVQAQVSPGVMFQIVVFACISGLVWLFAHAACMIVLNNSWRNRDSSFRVTFRILFSCAFALIFSSLIAKILISFGLMLYIIPGVIIGVLLFVYVPSVLFDGRGALSSLQHSFQLVKGNFGSTVWMCIITFFLIIFPEFVGMLIRGSGGMSNMQFGVDEVVTIFVSSLVIPLFSSLILTQYYALRTIHENKGN